MEALKFMLTKLTEQFAGIAILGHKDLPDVAKDCPCFDVREFCIKKSIDAGYYKGTI